MVEFLLVIQLCTAVDDCHWVRIDKFRSEEGCEAVGRVIDPKTIQFKCLMMERKKQPMIPLPTARPKELS